MSKNQPPKFFGVNHSRTFQPTKKLNLVFRLWIRARYAVVPRLREKGGSDNHAGTKLSSNLQSQMYKNDPESIQGPLQRDPKTSQNRRGVKLVRAICFRNLWPRMRPRFKGLKRPVARQREGTVVPLGRSGQTEEIASSYVFLASDDSSYMTGQVLHPNGGTVANRIVWACSFRRPRRKV